MVPLPEWLEAEARQPEKGLWGIPHWYRRGRAEGVTAEEGSRGTGFENRIRLSLAPGGSPSRKDQKDTHL